MLSEMTGKKTSEKEPAAEDDSPKERHKSKLTRAGETAQRELLLKTLTECGWNLTHASEALEMAGAGDVSRSIKILKLTDEYEAAKERGDAKAGRPPKSEK